MDLRKIKLDLTVALLNQRSVGESALQIVQDLMNSFKEVGSLQRLSQVRTAPLDGEHIQYDYQLEYDELTLNVEMVANHATNTTFLNRFSFQ
jgi:hypothetical protein